MKIIGRDNSGKRICIIDEHTFYFWAILKDNLSKEKIDKLLAKINKIQLNIRGRKTKVEKTELKDKNFLGKKVKAIKIFVTNYKDAHDVADHLGLPEIELRRGYDLKFITHYIIEKKINPLCWYEIEGEIEDRWGIENLDVDLCIRLDKTSKVRKIDKKKRADLVNSLINSGRGGRGADGGNLNVRAIKHEPPWSPKTLTYDIEVDELKIGKGEILMVSLVGENFKKVITWKHPKYKSDYVEHVKDEAELIEKFTEYVRKISPDFLVGYFSDGFDLPYLRARAEKNSMRLNLGLDDSQPKFTRGIITTGKINGIVHIDLLRFIQTAYSQYMQSETLSLNEVANEFLGDTKKPFKIRHSSVLEEKDWKYYFEYNLHDSVLTYNLFQKMWPDILEFTRIMQEPVFDVSRNGMSKNVESYIIHNLEKFNEIPEKRPTYDEIGKRRQREKYEGAFVFEPTPGLYENLAMFDFTSSYASVIVSYNLSKSTFLDKITKDSYSIETGGKKLYFSKSRGFVPEMLKEIIQKRKKFKKELKAKPDVIKKARSNAFKLLANAYYGYQGFFGARYYCEEAAAATAAFAKKSIKDVIEKINKADYKTIYSDTDSIAFLLNNKSKKQTLEFLKKLNSQLPGIMELELEDFYKRGIWVTKRTGTIGAKKKYALINEKGKIKIRGFETVRRDWCPLAREMQSKVIQMILKDGNEKKALNYVKQIVNKLKSRKISKEQIMIKTQLKKPISEYKSITPHVIAARKMQEKEMPIDMGNLIFYFIAETREKKKLVREMVKLPSEKGEYNIKYYLERQILPAIENIFQVFGINTKEMIEGKKQTTLGDF